MLKLRRTRSPSFDVGCSLLAIGCSFVVQIQALQADRFTEIFIAIGHASAVLTFEVRLADQNLVFLRIAEMKPLRDNIAKMFHERSAVTVWIMLYLLFFHFFPFQFFMPV